MKFAGYDFDEKFIVIKKENLKHLTDEEREELYDMLDKINEGRMREGKTNHGHLVVSCDEEYASEVANIIAEYHDIKKIKEVNKYGTTKPTLKQRFNQFFNKKKNKKKVKPTFLYNIGNQQRKQFTNRKYKIERI